MLPGIFIFDFDWKMMDMIPILPIYSSTFGNRWGSPSPPHRNNYMIKVVIYQVKLLFTYCQLMIWDRRTHWTTITDILMSDMFSSRNNNATISWLTVSVSLTFVVLAISLWIFNWGPGYCSCSFTQSISARVLNWGPGYAGEPLDKLLYHVTDGVIQSLDR